MQSPYPKCLFIMTDKARSKGGGRQKGVVVVKDKELKLEETEASLTLGGAGEGRVQGCGKGIRCMCSCAIRYTDIHQSCRFSHRPGCVAWTDAPVCMCERGAWGRGGCGLASAIRYT